MKKGLIAAVSIIGVAGIALGAGAAYIKVRKELKKTNSSKVLVEGNKVTVDTDCLDDETRQYLIETAYLLTGEAIEDENGNFIKIEVTEEEEKEKLKVKEVVLNFAKDHKKLAILGVGLFALLSGVIVAKKKGITKNTVLAFFKGGGSNGDCSVDSSLDLDFNTATSNPNTEAVASSVSSGFDLNF